jgi:hypothetical protein
MGLLGMFFVAMILVFTSMLVMTVVPSYIEYFSIKKVLDTMVADPQMQDAKISQIRESYTRRSGIDNITSVKASDLNISRDNGKLTLSAEYHVEKSLFANVGIYIDFAPTTAANVAP